MPPCTETALIYRASRSRFDCRADSFLLAPLVLLLTLFLYGTAFFGETALIYRALCLN